MKDNRSKFSSGLGFVLAASASAVGLGNIWRFPYLAAKYGGGIFLLIYIILVVTFGYSLMIAENSIGRMTGQSAMTAFGSLKKKWKPLGFLAILIPVIIMPYYNVIGGWVINYMFTYLRGAHSAAAGADFFGGMLADPVRMIICAAIFTLASAVVILRGVQKGVEKFSIVLMPILIALAAVISIYSIFQPGALEGVKYFFVPNFKDFHLSTLLPTILGAMGQMFYSLSLAMAIMITYGSYLSKSEDLEKNVSRIELFDTVIAILAGLMIIPAVFAFAGPDKLKSGPSLMFVVLPGVFESMGMPTFIGSLFFILVLFAALTSSISLMEAIVSAICDYFHTNRTKTTLGVTIGSLLVSCLPILGYNVLQNVKFFGTFDILDFMDFITNSVMMPICALLTCIFVAYGIGLKKVDAEIEQSSPFKRKKLFHVMIKYIAPIFVIAILVSSVLSSFGVITI